MRLLLKILVVVTWVMVGVFAAVKLRSAPQSAPELAVLGGWERSLPMLIRLGRERGLTVHALRAEDVGAQNLRARIGSAKVLLVLNAPHDDTLPRYQEQLRALQKEGRKFLVLDSRPWQGALVASGVLTRDELLSRYFRYSGEQNLGGMLDYVADKYLMLPRKVQPPAPAPSEGLYHPQAATLLKTPAELAALYKSRGFSEGAARVAYVVHSSFLLLKETEDIDALISAMERRKLQVFTIFADKEAVLRRLLLDVAPDVVLTQRHTGLGKPADGGVTIQERLGVPYLKPISALQTTVEAWRSRPEGLAPGDLAGQVIVQELEGTIEPLLISAQRTAGEYRIQVPIAERIERFADRTASWVLLRKTPAAQKRLAIIYYNADLGGESLAQGSVSGMFLDAPESLVQVSSALQQHGYRIQPPADKATLIERLRQTGRNLGPWAQSDIDAMALRPEVVRIAAADYVRWFRAHLTSEQQQAVIAKYGEPPGQLMVTHISGAPEIVIPQVVLGPGVSLFPQPEKGGRQDSRLVHDQTIPPSHQYIAFYLWLQEVYQPHALVHFGTHGTLELLPRRAAGMGPDDFADALLGKLPNINPWILDNVAEATLARRRAYAVLVDHLVPAIEKVETDRRFAVLHEEVERLIQLEAGPVREAFRKKIAAALTSTAYATDLLGKDAQLADMNVKELDMRLHALQEEQAPRSLHVLGQPPAAARLSGYIAAILGRAFQQRAGGRLLAEQLLACVLAPGVAPSSCTGFSPALQADVAGALRLRDNLLRTPQEITHLLDALDGKYVPPGPGNDPVRNPAAVPTGRNMYSLDPEQVPSAPAMEVGRAVAAQLIEAYRQKHGSIPKKVAINLNGFETMRDTGVTEAQVLALIGVEPVRDERGLVLDVRLLPRAALGRPRVDVVLAISGAYRDNFQSRVKLLDRALRMAQDAVEPDNALAAGTAAALLALRKDGLSEARAQQLARIRIYGQPPGQYGTQLLYLLPRSGAWQDRAEMAEVYRENMRFAYGQGLWGEQSDEGFREALRGADAASHVWASNMMSPLTNHHVYEYLGGLSMALERVNGRAPEALITDVRDPDRPRTRQLAEVLSTEGAARLLNERWIKDMQQQGYAGAGHVGAYVENLFGWSTTNPGSVDGKFFQRVDEVYREDTQKLGTRKWLERDNPDALLQVTVTLIESARRGYWSPGKERMERLTADYLSQVAKQGPSTGMMGGGNQALAAYVKQIYEAPGSRISTSVVAAYQARLAQAAAPSKPAATAAASAPSSTVVEGVKLRPPTAQESEKSAATSAPESPQQSPPVTSSEQSAASPFLALGPLLVVALGFFAALRQGRRGRRSAAVGRRS